MNHVHVLEESELLTHGQSFGFPLACAVDTYKRLLEAPLTCSVQVLRQRQEEIHTLRSHPGFVDWVLEDATKLKPYETIILEHRPNESTNTAEGQIFFTGEHTKGLNAIPFVITLCVFLKIWIAPALALLTPLILFCMPYIVLTTVMDMHLTWDTYTTMMQQMVFGVQAGEPWKLKHYGQAMWTLVSLGQSMITPFVTAYHTHALDQVICKRGEALIRFAEFTKLVHIRFQKMGLLQGEQWTCPTPPIEPREAAVWMNTEPLALRQLQRIAGYCVLTATLAHDTSWHPVTWTGSHTPLYLTDCHDFAIPSSRAVQSTLTLHTHSLLTGPNRGGKSSSLRAILQQVLLGQTFGFTKGAHGSWKPFHQIFTRLKSRDTAGKESLFEMEVRFASTILHAIKTRKHSLVCIDELFHSTNPPDAEISATVFLKQLWTYDSCKSIISTHIFKLCEIPQPIPLQTFCCDAKVNPDESIHYSYKLTNGVCRVSSVREVLEEANLIPRRALKPELKKTPDQQ
jgi:hypothetical protein